MLTLVTSRRTTPDVGVGLVRGVVQLRRGQLAAAQEGVQVQADAPQFYYNHN